MDEKILTVPTNSGMDAASLMAMQQNQMFNNPWAYLILLSIYPLLKSWFPEEKDFKDKIIELSINWLNDEDYPDHKIWNYFR